MFKTDVEKGLSSDAVEKLRAHYGNNELPKPPKPSLLLMLLSQVTDFMIIILLIVAIVEASLKDYKEAVVLFAVIVMNIIIGFSQEYKAKQALEALMSLSVPTVSTFVYKSNPCVSFTYHPTTIGSRQAVVIRDGVPASINSVEVVPGDVVVLEEGDAVPADLRIVEASQLEIVEALLTGESVPVAKNPKHIRAAVSTDLTGVDSDG